jgi:hypothetical protein
VTAATVSGGAVMVSLIASGMLATGSSVHLCKAASATGRGTGHEDERRQRLHWSRRAVTSVRY